MSDIKYPRITIQYCTQCKWMLRAAYFGQELLSTFSVTLGEVSLQPATGGLFRVTVYTSPESPGVQVWDRKEKGGFPEVKLLKRAVRDVVEPERDLGHNEIKETPKVSDPDPDPETPAEACVSGECKI